MKKNTKYRVVYYITVLGLALGLALGILYGLSAVPYASLGDDFAGGSEVLRLAVAGGIGIVTLVVIALISFAVNFISIMIQMKLRK